MKKHKSTQIAACVLLLATAAVTTAACKSSTPSPTDSSLMGAELDTTSGFVDVLPGQELLTDPVIRDSEKEPESTAPPTTAVTKDVNSHRALFSLSYGGGFGTLEETATTTVTVYANGLVGACKLGRHTPLAELTEEDFEAVVSMVTPDALEGMEVEEDWGVCDGGGRDITIYDENGEVLLEKGGYSPGGEEFKRLYQDTMRILRRYVLE